MSMQSLPSSTSNKKNSGDHAIKQAFFWLLIIICIGSAGSFPLVQHLLPDTVLQTLPTTQTQVIRLQAYP